MNALEEMIIQVVVGVGASYVSLNISYKFFDGKKTFLSWLLGCPVAIVAGIGLMYIFKNII